jgi:hypothetical protein
VIFPSHFIVTSFHHIITITHHHTTLPLASHDMVVQNNSGKTEIKESGGWTRIGVLWKESENRQNSNESEKL